MELLNKKELNQIKTDLSALRLLHLTPEIGVKFIQLMGDYSLSHKLSLPDGLIAATSIVEGISLYTHNVKDFKYIKGVKLFKEK